ncbi:hypothetical protein [Fulvivirga lutimaris]|uniref:hypothetical protein n=1 Tax=Fulvivirga lutimaris TaxID=1819566 RepID=UPI0012BBC427|nr:hypothetical protein [Fulvivirga lutimaris]MTI40547.1 hypothetical protein [Fulvivirga lutimaris]
MDTEAEQKHEEILYKDSVWLNDAVQFTSTQKEVLDKLGKPDSITTPMFECGAYIQGEEPWGDKVNIWHYQGTEIVTFKDRAEIMKIRLKGWECTLHDSQMIFSGETSIEDLREVFPKSVKNSYEWKDVTKGIRYTLVKIAPNPNYDDSWILKFYKNQLIEIEYYTPC